MKSNFCRSFLILAVGAGFVQPSAEAKDLSTMAEIHSAVRDARAGLSSVSLVRVSEQVNFENNGAGSGAPVYKTTETSVWTEGFFKCESREGFAGDSRSQVERAGLDSTEIRMEYAKRGSTATANIHFHNLLNSTPVGNEGMQVLNGSFLRRDFQVVGREIRAGADVIHIVALCSGEDASNPLANRVHLYLDPAQGCMPVEEALMRGDLKVTGTRYQYAPGEGFGPVPTRCIYTVYGADGMTVASRREDNYTHVVVNPPLDGVFKLPVPAGTRISDWTGGPEEVAVQGAEGPLRAVAPAYRRVTSGPEVLDLVR